MQGANYFILVERLLVVGAAIYLTYLGHSLFKFGVLETDADMQSKGIIKRLLFSGTGAGLFLMAVGAMLLALIAYFGNAQYLQLGSSKNKASNLQRMGAGGTGQSESTTFTFVPEGSTAPEPPERNLLSVPSIPLDEAGLTVLSSESEPETGTGEDTRLVERSSESAGEATVATPESPSKPGGKAPPNKEPNENVKVTVSQPAAQK